MSELAAWVPCIDCDDYWCNLCRTHVADCDCPPIEEWIENGKDPYIDKN